MTPISQQLDTALFQATVYTSAAECLDATEHLLLPLHELECGTTFIYSHLLFTRTSESIINQLLVQHPQLWICLWSSSTIQHQTRTRTLDFILTVTNGPLGPQPIYITPIEFNIDTASRHEIDGRIRHLASCLHEAIPADRVYSVNGPTTITKAFVKAWCRITQAIPHQQPYTSITPISFTNIPNPSLPEGHFQTVRLARTFDLPKISRLLQESTWSHVRSTTAKSFTLLTSLIKDPYSLSLEQAQQVSEANVRAKKCFVVDHMESDGTPSICAFAFLDFVAPKTVIVARLHTDAKCVHQSCDAYLLENLFLLLQRQKVRIFLLLHDGSDMASKMASRSGFRQHFDMSQQRSWLEVGFEDCTIGHW